MQPFRPPSPWLQTPRKFIDNDDGTVLYHVFFISLKKGFRAHCGLQMMDILNTCVGIDILDAKRTLRLLDAAIGELYLLVLMVDRIIFFRYERGSNLREAPIERFRVGDRRRNNERRTRFIDKNRVYFINNSEVVGMLPQILRFVL